MCSWSVSMRLKQNKKKEATTHTHSGKTRKWQQRDTTHKLSRHTSRWHGPTNFDLLLLQQWIYSLFWFHHLNPYLFQYFFLSVRVCEFSSSVPSSALNSYWISSNIAHLNGRLPHTHMQPNIKVRINHESIRKFNWKRKRSPCIDMHGYK